jgi:hypothetical protein
MLFDLKGRRRRVIQVTYLALAVLMGGGLVLFGIGGDVSGGLFDAFSDRSDSGSGNPIVERRLDQAEAALQRNPNDQAALAALARARFQLAGTDTDPTTGVYGVEGRVELRRAADAWERYLRTNPDPPNLSLARVMLQVYSEFGLNQPAQAVKAAEIVAEQDQSSSSFLQLARYAALAKQDRKAKLAGRRAIALAPEAQRNTVRKQVKALEQAAKAQQAAGGAGGAAPGGSPSPALPSGGGGR